jgi:uncharacterized protein YbbC (DUF1343 family)
MSFELGLERLLKDAKLKTALKGRRVGLLAHPASVDKNLNHAIDLLFAAGIPLTCAFGPQHGIKGEKQDNMIESADIIDEVYNIPLFSLYGKVRRPTPQMLEHFDVLLIDLQDVGCRIYTFLTTLFYLLEDATKAKKEIWVLDRPNPAGRPIEGSLLREGFESFVGAAPVPMRHGLTLGEAAHWYKHHKNLDVHLEVIKMADYNPMVAPGYGWPEKDLSWVNPSPNMPRLSTARVYPGSVLIEGTTLSEGRGTTIPLEILGAPGLQTRALLEQLHRDFEPWLRGARIRPIAFEPTFHKFAGQLVSGLHFHADDRFYDPLTFQPYRAFAAILKVVRRLNPDMVIWKQPPYEYETVNLPFDILSGSAFLREWVDDVSAGIGELENYLKPDEQHWDVARRGHLFY